MFAVYCTNTYALKYNWIKGDMKSRSDPGIQENLFRCCLMQMSKNPLQPNSASLNLGADEPQQQTTSPVSTPVS